MWKDYSAGFMRNNRASSISLMATALIASLFLSFLCTLFYNLWQDSVRQTVEEEGDWQGRITGELEAEELKILEGFANVERVVVNRELSRERQKTVDVYFYNPRTIFRDMPLLTERLGLPESAGEYHLKLLSRYLIHDPDDKEPPLLLSLYLAILLLTSLSLILVIHNAFGVSMNRRIRQFGILSSIGATPGQIRGCLLREAGVLCLGPVLLGIGLGALLYCGAMKGMDILAADLMGRHQVVFAYHPLIFVVTALACLGTVFLSAWLPAWKLSRITPLEAIRSTGELELQRRQSSRILGYLFGIEGELAGNALKAQRKVLRTSALSLTLAFLGFSMMLCFFALSRLSVEQTYYERYRDTWDVMVTLREGRIEEFPGTEKMLSLSGAQSATVYQKAEALGLIPDEMLSQEAAALGGPEGMGAVVSQEDGFCLVEAPVVVLNDAAFLKYCEDLGISPGLTGAVVLNRFWDSTNSHFRNPAYVPYVREDGKTVLLNRGVREAEAVEIPVLAYTQEPPVLREEYQDYALVHFVPVSLWRKYAIWMEGPREALSIQIKAGEGASLEELEILEEEALQAVGDDCEAESENRIREQLTSEDIIRGYMAILGAICVLLAMIGIANIFSNALGLMQQRKREFARYLSVGLTMGGIRKMLCIEAMVIAGRPALRALPFTLLFMGFAVKASHISMADFLPVAPVAPVLIFILAVFASVALAYYLGGRALFRSDLGEALRDEAML